MILFFKKVRFTWKTKISVSVAALMCTFFLVTISGSPTNAEDVAGASSCQYRSTGFVTESLVSVSSLLGPAAYNSCSGLGTFMYVPPDLESVLGDEARYIDPGQYVHGGATGSLAYVGSLVMDNQPVGTPAYARVVAESVGIAKSAEAAVPMSKAFSPVIIIWQNMRNLAYIFMTVVLLALGLIVMLRVRTGGKEPVNAVMSLVGVAISLILITFSYPIASLICDLCINVGNGLVASIMNRYINASDILIALETPGSGRNVVSMMTELQRAGIGSSAERMMAAVLVEFNIPMAKITEMFRSMEGDPLAWLVGRIGAGLSQLLFGIFAGLAKNVTGNPLIMAIVSFVIFVTMARMVFAMIGAYFSLAIKVAFSPFAFIGVAFPGGMASLGNWVKNIAADALVFPTIFAMILLSAVFFDLRRVPLSSDQANVCPDVVSEASTPTRSYIFNTKPYNTYESEKEYCYPAILPPEFNYWPAPMGYIRGVSPDQLMRAVLGIGVILAAPAAGSMWKELLQVKDYRFMQQVTGGLRAGLSMFGAMVGRVPSLGFGRAMSQITQQVGSSF